MSKEKLARRKAAGDDPTAMSKSNSSEAGMVPPQPIPGAPQGKGNMMNNPMVGQSMGGGMHQPGKIDQNNSQSPYGDPVFSPDVLMKTGAVGFTGNSGAPQNFVAGRGYNQQPYGTVDQPKGESQGMMEPMYLAKEAGDRAEKLYAGGAAGDQTRMMPSYQVGPLGMMGTLLISSFKVHLILVKFLEHNLNKCLICQGCKECLMHRWQQVLMCNHQAQISKYSVKTVRGQRNGNYCNKQTTPANRQGFS